MAGAGSRPEAQSLRDAARRDNRRGKGVGKYHSNTNVKPVTLAPLSVGVPTWSPIVALPGSWAGRHHMLNFAKLTGSGAATRVWPSSRAPEAVIAL